MKLKQLEKNEADNSPAKMFYFNGQLPHKIQMRNSVRKEQEQAIRRPIVAPKPPNSAEFTW